MSSDAPLARRKKRVRSPQHTGGRAEGGPRLVVVGGGIAGVCCAQELARTFSEHTITLIAMGDVLKESSSVMKITNSLEEISVFERRSEFFKIDNPNIHIIDACLQRIDIVGCILHLLDRNKMPLEVGYDRVCLCTGARPSLLVANHPRVLGLRDLETVNNLFCKLRSARRIIVVGNGGIALELIHALSFLHVIWVVKEDYIGHTFFDASAAAFIMPSLSNRLQASRSNISEESFGRARGGVVEVNEPEKMSDKYADSVGGGVGPEWLKKSNFLSNLIEKGRIKNENKIDGDSTGTGSLQVEYSQHIFAIREVKRGIVSLSGQSVTVEQGNYWLKVGINDVKEHQRLDDEESLRADAIFIAYLRSQSARCHPRSAVDSDLECRFPLYVLTTNDNIFGCDYLISATGVNANTAYLDESRKEDSDSTDLSREDVIARRPTGEIIVDEGLQSVTNSKVFAAGDCCLVALEERHDRQLRHWFQMKLWSQARSMGIYAAHCIGRSVELGISLNHQRLVTNDLDTIYGNSMLEMFAHITHFFDHKVVLLGRFNSQGLGSRVEDCTKDIVVTAEGLRSLSAEQLSEKDNSTKLPSLNPRKDKVEQNNCKDSVANHVFNLATNNTTADGMEIWTRVTPGQEYVKVTVNCGKIVGAMLIGDTGLEETFENLILNGTDISAYGIHILNPDLDLEDFFD